MGTSVCSGNRVGTKDSHKENKFSSVRKNAVGIKDANIIILILEEIFKQPGFIQCSWYLEDVGKPVHYLFQSL